MIIRLPVTAWTVTTTGAVCRRHMAPSAKKGDLHMNEKVYRSMSLAGACNIAVGIVILVVGIAAGVMAIISGAGLLKTKKNIMF